MEGPSWLRAWSLNEPAELAAKREQDWELLGRCLATLGLYGSRGLRDTGKGVEDTWRETGFEVGAEFIFNYLFLLVPSVVITMILQHW